MTDFKDTIHTKITAEKDAMLAFWKTLVHHESGSSDKEGLDDTRDFIVAHCKELGATVKTTPYEKAGDLIVATWNGDVDAAPIILSGHYDTVFKRGTVAERPFTIKDGKAYGPGALDMKAGITMALFTIKTLLSLGYKDRPLKLVLAGDEEVGHQFSTAAEDFAKAVTGAKAAFNFETGYTDNGIVIGRKGGARALIRCKGIGAHAGNEPEKGRSAILELAHKTIDIQSRNDYEAGITYNVGVFQGGTVANAVPEDASMVVDIRFRRNEQLDIVKKRLRRSHGYHPCGRYHIDDEIQLIHHSDGNDGRRAEAIRPLQDRSSRAGLWRICSEIRGRRCRLGLRGKSRRSHHLCRWRSRRQKPHRRRICRCGLSLHQNGNRLEHNFTGRLRTTVTPLTYYSIRQTLSTTGHTTV